MDATNSTTPRCELCDTPAVLIGEQWTCPGCSPSGEPAHTFTTIAVAEILDALTDAIDTIRSSTAIYNAPWMKALDKAWDTILHLDTLEYDVAARAWRVESGSEPGRFYTANGDCQCPAFVKGAGICYHRAGARLIARALELRELAAELVAHAHEDGEVWYGEHEACIGARWRLPELAILAAEWDAGAAALRARIGGAQARAMAQAAAMRAYEALSREERARVARLVSQTGAPLAIAVAAVVATRPQQ